MSERPAAERLTTDDLAWLREREAFERKQASYWAKRDPPLAIESKRDADRLARVLAELDAVTRERDEEQPAAAVARTVTDAQVERAAKVICESGTHSWDDDLDMRALYTQIARRALTAALGGAK